MPSRNGTGRQRRGHSLTALRRQRGQALVYGLFVFVGGLAALFFLFNSSQLVREKSKLVDTADAVAYSAGVVQARALNFAAYNNRALVANEALIAQLVSVASWSAHVEEWDDNLDDIHPECEGMSQAEDGNYWGAFFSAVASMRKFDVDYGLACALMKTSYGQDYIDQMTSAVSDIAPPLLAFAEAGKALIRASQASLFASLMNTRTSVMQQVADANYGGANRVAVESGLSAGLADDWLGFTAYYDGDRRQRMKDVVVTAAHSDPFVRQRNWTSRAILPEPSCLPLGSVVYNEVRRRGGTELLGFDDWQAIDTQSFRERYRRRLSCRQRENPTGWASEQAAAEDQAPGYDGFGGAAQGTPGAFNRAVRGTQDLGRYSGLPGIFDLSETWSSGANRSTRPMARHGIRLVRDRNLLNTSDQASPIGTTPNSRINRYASTVAGDQMAAVSTVEVFFERPPASPRNAFGQAAAGRSEELGSLFNPYWQVRLVNSPLAAAWQRQGAGIPW